jgi:hypothetical protein
VVVLAALAVLIWRFLRDQPVVLTCKVLVSLNETVVVRDARFTKQTVTSSVSDPPTTPLGARLALNSKVGGAKTPSHLLGG